MSSTCHCQSRSVFQHVVLGPCSPLPATSGPVPHLTDFLRGLQLPLYGTILVAFLSPHPACGMFFAFACFSFFFFYSLLFSQIPLVS